MSKLAENRTETRDVISETVADIVNKANGSHRFIWAHAPQIDRYTSFFESATKGIVLSLHIELKAKAAVNELKWDVHRYLTSTNYGEFVGLGGDNLLIIRNFHEIVGSKNCLELCEFIRNIFDRCRFGLVILAETGDLEKIKSARDRAFYSQFISRISETVKLPEE